MRRGLLRARPFFIALGVVGVALWAIYYVPQWQTEHLSHQSDALEHKDYLDIKNEYRKTVIQFVGGAVLLYGLFLTLRRVKATEQGQITERFTRAIDQLGHDKTEVHLGGIYALERIARDSKDDHWTVVEVLSAFIRMNRPYPSKKELKWQEEIAAHEHATEKAKEASIDPPTLDATEPEPEAPGTDVQAALTVLGRRNKWRRNWRELEPGTMNLSRSDLRNAQLGGVHLEGANLGGAHLEGAHLWEAHLERAHLSEAHLERAYLREAHLERAYLREAHLEGAYLRGAHLERAYLREAHLEGAHLERAQLGGAQGVTQEQIDSILTWDENTEFPEGLSPPPTREQARHRISRGGKRGMSTQTRIIVLKETAGRGASPGPPLRRPFRTMHHPGGVGKQGFGGGPVIPSAPFDTRTPPAPCGNKRSCVPPANFSWKLDEPPND